MKLFKLNQVLRVRLAVNHVCRLIELFYQNVTKPNRSTYTRHGKDHVMSKV